MPPQLILFIICIISSQTSIILNTEKAPRRDLIYGQKIKQHRINDAAA